MSAVEFACIVSRPFMENTWIVWRSGRSDCVVVDPGFEPRKITAFLESRGLTPALIALTHGHADHIAGNRALKAAYPELPIAIGEGDAHMLSDPEANLSGLASVPVTSPPADVLLREGDVVEQAGLRWLVREIPGHSPGHIVFIDNDGPVPYVVGGDVLFQGSIGRTDFPGGDLDQLLDGIRRKLYVLPDETIVYPGHGDPTRIGDERTTNPYCRGV